MYVKKISIFAKKLLEILLDCIRCMTKCHCVSFFFPEQFLNTIFFIL